MADMVDKDRVAVRLGLGQPRRADGAARPADVFDDHLRLEHISHGLGSQAGDRIRRTTGRKGNDDGNRLAGIILGLGQRNGAKRQTGDKQTYGAVFHGGLRKDVVGKAATAMSVSARDPATSITKIYITLISCAKRSTACQSVNSTTVDGSVGPLVIHMMNWIAQRS